jgi:hypothetical protein
VCGSGESTIRWRFSGRRDGRDGAISLLIRDVVSRCTLVLLSDETTLEVPGVLHRCRGEGKSGSFKTRLRDRLFRRSTLWCDEVLLMECCVRSSRSFMGVAPTLLLRRALLDLDCSLTGASIAAAAAFDVVE